MNFLFQVKIVLQFGKYLTLNIVLLLKLAAIILNNRILDVTHVIFHQMKVYVNFVQFIVIKDIRFIMMESIIVIVIVLLNHQDVYLIQIIKILLIIITLHIIILELLEKQLLLECGVSNLVQLIL